MTAKPAHYGIFKGALEIPGRQIACDHRLTQKPKYRADIPELEFDGACTLNGSFLETLVLLCFDTCSATNSIGQHHE